MSLGGAAGDLSIAFSPQDKKLEQFWQYKEEGKTYFKNHCTDCEGSYQIRLLQKMTYHENDQLRISYKSIHNFVIDHFA